MEQTFTLINNETPQVVIACPMRDFVQSILELLNSRPFITSRIRQFAAARQIHRNTKEWKNDRLDRLYGSLKNIRNCLQTMTSFFETLRDETKSNLRIKTSFAELVVRSAEKIRAALENDKSLWLDLYEIQQKDLDASPHKKIPTSQVLAVGGICTTTLVFFQPIAALTCAIVTAGAAAYNSYSPVKTDIEEPKIEIEILRELDNQIQFFKDFEEAGKHIPKRAANLPEGDNSELPPLYFSLEDLPLMERNVLPGTIDEVIQKLNQITDGLNKLFGFEQL